MSAPNGFEDKPQHHNLITPYFNTLIQQKHADLSIWLVKVEDKPQLIEFIETENSGKGIFESRLIVLNTPFISPSEYSGDLLKDLKSKYRATGSGVFSEVEFGQNNNATSLLLKELSAIGSKLPEAEKTLILWLIPNNVADAYEAELWMETLLQLEIPENIKIAFTTASDKNNFENIFGKFGERVFLLRPDNNLAYNDLVEDLKDPYVQFRNYFLEFGEAVSAGDYVLALKIGEKAIALAKQQNDWEQQEVGMLIAMAELLIEDEAQKAKAMSYFDLAETSARLACEKEHPSGKVLLLQTLNAKGSAHIYLGNFNEAITIMQTSIEKAERDDYCFYYLMEAQRLTALCYEQMADFSKAWMFNEDALKTAESLDQQIRMRTTVPSIGEALFRLSAVLKKDHETHRINHKLVELVGEDWQELI
jgi:tetratricopeptide (TPR) repeat protein